MHYQDEMIEALVKGAASGMSAELIPDYTTNEDVIDAAFTFLDRTLRAVRRLQPPSERFANAERITQAHQEMLTDHGKVPS